MGRVAHVGENGNPHTILVGKPKGCRPLGRPVHCWEYNINMDLK
jgi:hypothetical protein